MTDLAATHNVYGRVSMSTSTSMRISITGSVCVAVAIAIVSTVAVSISGGGVAFHSGSCQVPQWNWQAFHGQPVVVAAFVHKAVCYRGCAHASSEEVGTAIGGAKGVVGDWVWKVRGIAPLTVSYR